MADWIQNIYKATGSKTKLCAAGFAILCGIIGLSSCTDNTLYHHFEHLENNVWHKTDSVIISPIISDSAFTVQVYVELRNTSAYPYRNLPMEMVVEYPDSTQMQPVSIEAEIADEQGGWTGTGHSGLYHHAIHAADLRIDHPGTYRFKLSCALADSVVYGVKDIGIRLKK